jgi:hypothetical protein
MEGNYVTVLIYRRGCKTDCSNYQGMLLLSTLYILSNILPSRFTHMQLLGISGVDHDILDQLQIRYPAFITYWKRNSTMEWYTSYI